MGPVAGRDGLTPVGDAVAALAAEVSRGSSTVADAMGVAIGLAARARGVDPSVLGPLGRRPGAFRPHEALADALGSLAAAPAPTGSAPRPSGSARSVSSAFPWSPERLGALHQTLVPAPTRRRRGVHYTPSAVAEALVATAAALAAVEDGPVLDPSCGGGAFLLAAARHLHARGWPPGEVLDRLGGIDVDPVAVEVTVAVLRLWALDAGVGPDGRVDGSGPASGGPWVVVGDALDLDVAWCGPDGRAPSLIVGNPPFGGQLGRATARSAAGRRQARDRLGRPAGYADTAALFLCRAVDEVGPGGVVALLQPLSVLAARDTSAIRVDTEPWLQTMWVGDGRHFDASVHVCAPVLRRPVDGAPEARPPGAAATSGPAVAPLWPGSPTPSGLPDSSVGAGPPVEVRRGVGTGLAVVGTVPRQRLAAGASWSPLWAMAADVPDVDLTGRPTLGTWGTATAGFRDEFYALAPLVHDDPDPRPEDAPAVGQRRVLTSGLIDAVGVGWGRRTCRLAGRRLTAPTVDLAAVERSPEARLRALLTMRSGPKVVVATQSRVLEAAVDDDGRYWPSVPLVTVLLRPELDDSEHRWLVAAALTAPPVTAWALLAAGGSALSPGAVKLAARQVLEVPLPIDEGAWRRGARWLRDGVGLDGSAPRLDVMARAGRELIAAHGIADADAEHLLAWWLERLAGSPSRRRRAERGRVPEA